ncbi:TIGR02265 family protein [Melittangium boletus]|uniref:TIGR02265 family protein n=1 Tax=Melittangium boletus TaxID=83453 RepID=UPI003DA643A1
MPSDKNDLVQRVAICKPDDTVRGFLFKSVYTLVEQRVGSSGTDRMLQQLRINKMPVDFFSYPAADFLRMLYTAADVLEPHYASVEDAIRACGGATVTGFFKSYVGNTLMRLVGIGDPKRVFASVDTIYSTLVSYGKRTSEDLGDKRLRLHYRGDMQPIAFHEGALREALVVLRGNGTAKGTAVALNYGQYVLEWT